MKMFFEDMYSINTSNYITQIYNNYKSNDILVNQPIQEKQIPVPDGYTLIEDDNYIIRDNDEYYYKSWENFTGQSFHNFRGECRKYIGLTKKRMSDITLGEFQSNNILYIASMKPRFKTDKPYPWGY